MKIIVWLAIFLLIPITKGSLKRKQKILKVDDLVVVKNYIVDW